MGARKSKPRGTDSAFLLRSEKDSSIFKKRLVLTSSEELLDKFEIAESTPKQRQTIEIRNFR
ncbi:MAG: hypothetical protein ABR981_02680 [Candidatus Micrarchaeaceae archaeon]|jgi:hypothetical protein